MKPLEKLTHPGEAHAGNLRRRPHSSSATHLCNK